MHPHSILLWHPHSPHSILLGHETIIVPWFWGYPSTMVDLCVVRFCSTTGREYHDLALRIHADREAVLIYTDRVVAVPSSDLSQSPTVNSQTLTKAHLLFHTSTFSISCKKVQSRFPLKTLTTESPRDSQKRVPLTPHDQHAGISRISRRRHRLDGTVRSVRRDGS